MAFDDPDAGQGDDPLILTIAFRDFSSSARWLARWETAFPQSRRIDPGAARASRRTAVFNAINLAVHGASRPVLLAAHGAACLAVAGWASHEPDEGTALIRGALLFDPPLPLGPQPAEEPIWEVPSQPLPFSACILASQARGRLELFQLRRLAGHWQCHFDSIRDGSLPRPRIVHPVQPLGERFFARSMEGAPLHPPAPAHGYPVIRR